MIFHLRLVGKTRPEARGTALADGFGGPDHSSDPQSSTEADVFVLDSQIGDI